MENEKKSASTIQCNLSDFDIENGVLKNYKGEGGDIIIPDGVTEISYDAFYKCSGLTSVTIPDSVKSIDFMAFYNCSSLANITIPDGVTDIAGQAFPRSDQLVYNEYDNAYYLGNETNPYVVLMKAKDTSITNCEIHPNTKVIYGNAFYGCSGLTNVTIPDSVKSIGWSAFAGCSGLTSITIPDSVTNIKGWAFDECLGLTNITIPDSVTYIGDYAFEACDNLVYNEYGNAYYLGNETNPYVVLMKAKDTSITSCEINGNAKAIYDMAFYECSGLKDITIPDSVKSIGWSAFDGCSGLTSMAIPDGVTSVREYIFMNCSGLTSVMIPDSVTYIDDGAFYYCRGLTSITIPNSVTSIGEYAFYGCSSLTSITISDSVMTIEEAAFAGCSGLKSVMMPDSVTYIGDGAFYGCSDLTSITVSDENKKYHSAGNCIIETETGELILGCKNSIIPDDGSVKSIGCVAFAPCPDLTSITIPFSVTEICIETLTKMKNITFNGTKKQWKIIKWSGNQGDMPENCIVHCIDGDIEI